MARELQITKDPSGKWVYVMFMNVETVQAPVASTTIPLGVLDFLIRAKGVELHSLAANLSAGFAPWTLQTKHSFNGQDYSTATTIASSSASGNVISAQFTDRTKFGRYNQFELVLGAAGDAGTLSLMLVVELMT